MPAGRLRWAAPGTIHVPYKRRKETFPETLHSEEIWEGHRDTIQGLRKTMTLQRIAQAMASRGFNASQAQYKHHLKRWGDKKYLKFTEEQLVFVIRKITNRLKKGEKAAVRLNGEKIPSTKMDQYLRKYSDMIEKCAEEESQAEDLSEYTECCDSHEIDDSGGDAVMIDFSFTESPPTIIDSLRITVYTSSTTNGIRKLFPWRKVLLTRPREAEEDMPDCTIKIEETTGTSSEGLSELGAVTSVDPSTLELGPRDKNTSYSGIYMSSSKPTGHCTWDSISEEIFGQKNDSKSSQLLFNPAVKFDPATQKSALVVKSDTLHDTFRYLRDLVHQSHIDEGRQRFIGFLSKHGQDSQLYRREIDINDCPDAVWAVDMIGWRAQVRRQGNGQPTSDKVSKPQILAMAWCVRPAANWSEWLGGEDPARVFKCRHSTHSLKSDGPVIFVDTLKKACWQQGGCQWRRVVGGSENLASASYSPWSESASIIQDIL